MALRKRLFLLLSAAVFPFFVHAQFTHKIKADSVRIYNDSCNAELILENSTRNVSGFLFNTGNGRTQFKKAVIKLNDSSFLIGADTLLIKSADISGTNNYVAKFTGTNQLRNSNIYDDGNYVGIGTATPGNYALDVAGLNGINVRGVTGGVTYTSRSGTGNSWVTYNNNGSLYFYNSGAEKVSFLSSGNVGIGTTADNGSKLQVEGGISQKNITSSLIKANSTGELVAAISGVDYATTGDAGFIHNDTSTTQSGGKGFRLGTGTKGFVDTVYTKQAYVGGLQVYGNADLSARPDKLSLNYYSQYELGDLLLPPGKTLYIQRYGDPVTIGSFGSLNDGTVTTINKLTSINDGALSWLDSYSFPSWTGSNNRMISVMTGGTGYLYTNNNLPMRIGMGGNVGIDKSPTTKLDVNGTGKFTDAIAAALYGGSNTGENLFLGSTSHTTKGKINIANTLYIDEVNGIAGINTSTPSYGLHVNKVRNTVGIASTGIANDQDVAFYAAGAIGPGNVYLLTDNIAAYGEVIASVKNTHSTYWAANASLQAIVNGASAGDPYVSLVVSGQQAWSAGIDNSDNDKFKIGPNSTPSDGTAAITIDVAGNTAFANAITAASFSGAGTGLTGIASALNIGGNAGTVTNGVYTTGNQTIGGQKTFSSNIITTGTGVLVAPSTSTSTALIHLLNGTDGFSIGKDNAAGDNFGLGAYAANIFVHGKHNLNISTNGTLLATFDTSGRYWSYAPIHNAATPYTTGGFSVLVKNNISQRYEIIGKETLQSFLDLGSMAFTSTGSYLPLSGGTMSGSIANTLTGSTAALDMTGATTSEKRVIHIGSTGTDYYQGIASSTGSSPVSGTTAYQAYFRNDRGFAFGNSTEFKYTIDAYGNNKWTGTGVFGWEPPVNYFNPYLAVSKASNDKVSIQVSNQELTPTAGAYYTSAAYGGSWYWGNGSSSSAYGNDWVLGYDISSSSNPPVIRIAPGSGNTSFNSTVTANSFIKSGGTSAQFLKADGSTDNAAYLPLTGGTITGGLWGTGASFSNTVFSKAGGNDDYAYIAYKNGSTSKLGAFYQNGTGDGSLLLFNTTADAVTVHLNGANGSASFDGTVTASGVPLTSDARLKNIISRSNSKDGIDMVSFKWKDTKKGTGLQYGYIAQEVQKKMPDAIFTNDKTGYLSVDYTQVHTVKIDQLEKKVKELEEIITKLMSELKK
ncbi:tail fiber domain-containing protein [Sediminibacterium ginsengisoli]|uniref:Chaperone of endosialidase n=1 Tax=Sediminibacterium ginsengisoli TaxID=413434 RepID=A0A1T4PNL7_9BACT|nr:tail fiber domain-containing protein [Sediminibacterium ginsengisoli]SJZ93164.1 Chaperone of endosialidase [Sediminibacterium ginsengisoli]